MGLSISGSGKGCVQFNQEMKPGKLLFIRRAWFEAGKRNNESKGKF